eukprot:779378-Pelagomonas_calceolata.AAC.5
MRSTAGGRFGWGRRGSACCRAAKGGNKLMGPILLLLLLIVVFWLPGQNDRLPQHLLHRIPLLFPLAALPSTPCRLTVPWTCSYYILSRSSSSSSSPSAQPRSAGPRCSSFCSPR